MNGKSRAILNLGLGNQGQDIRVTKVAKDTWQLELRPRGPGNITIVLNDVARRHLLNQLGGKETYNGSEEGSKKDK